MKKVFKGLTAVLTVLLFSICLVTPALAVGQGSFLVSPRLPENQREGVKSYFDLIARPGQVQELAILVTNQSDEEIVVEAEVVAASTNSNGIINYTTEGESLDSLAYRLSDLLTIEEPVLRIPAGSSRAVGITLLMPEEAYEGYLLGSIHIKKQLTEAELGSGQAIINQYSYVTAFKVAMSEEGVENDFALDTVEAQLVNGRASIVGRIENPRPVMVKGMHTTMRIFPKGSETPIMERTMEDTEMAPHSVFPFTLVDDAGYGVKAGAYLSQVEITHKGRVWTFEQEFAIKAEQAAQINSGAVNLATRQTAMAGIPMWVAIALIAAAVLLLLMAAVLVYFIKRAKAGGRSGPTLL